MLSVLLRGASFHKKDIFVLYQEDTVESHFIWVSKPDKPYMLKNLIVVVNLLGGEGFRANDILLIDDSPEKNLLNDPYNVGLGQTIIIH